MGKRKTSAALVEVRTVASRAETALFQIRNLPAHRDRQRAFGETLVKRGEATGDRRDVASGEEYINLTGYHARYAEDPDEPAMIEALQAVAALLEKWR